MQKKFSITRFLSSQTQTKNSYIGGTTGTGIRNNPHQFILTFYSLGLILY